MTVNSDVRSQALKYLVGADVPKDSYSDGKEIYKLQHFSIPFGYSKVFTERIKYAVLHLTPDSKLDDVNPKLLGDVLSYRKLLEEDEWISFKKKIGPIRYKKIVSAIASLNMGLVDAKVTIDLKRILRLPSTLHSGVKISCRG